ncbi:hypothetical protein VCR31J2_1310658 [Vibrio coralliirubri]|uniref:Uncharacterized protein n=1 Tax=Vibrio coralliirubri TaxID=1516159 RepID=A0AA86WP37_9VIBR|nr:hypothetical protein VCR31J2_1310658 [Vibrio coralliirubri]
MPRNLSWVISRIFSGKEELEEGKMRVGSNHISYGESFKCNCRKCLWQSLNEAFIN